MGRYNLWLKCYERRLLSTDRGVFRVRCGVWPDGTKMPNFLCVTDAIAQAAYSDHSVCQSAAFCIVTKRCEIGL